MIELEEIKNQQFYYYLDIRISSKTFRLLCNRFYKVVANQVHYKEDPPKVLEFRMAPVEKDKLDGSSSYFQGVTVSNIFHWSREELANLYKTREEAVEVRKRILTESLAELEKLREKQTKYLNKLINLKDK